MKPVDILGRVDRFDHEALIDVPWQRHLDEDPVDPLVGVEILDQAQELGLRRRVWQVVADRDETALLARETLVADVDLRSGIVAHEQHGEAWATTTTRGKPVAVLADLAPHCRRDRLAVDDLCRHAWTGAKGRAFWHGRRGS